MVGPPWIAVLGSGPRVDADHRSHTNPLTGKPDAGDPPVRFGGRGSGKPLSLPLSLSLAKDSCRILAIHPRLAISGRSGSHGGRKTIAPSPAMIALAFRLLLFASLLIVAGPLRALETEDLCHYAGRFFAPPDAAEQRRYAPSREIDILHLALEVTPDFKQRSIEGKVTLKFKPIAQPFPELKLDGIDLTVRSVDSTAKIVGWQATDKQVIVTFDPPIPAEQEASVTIVYHDQPEKGLYFRTPEMGYKPEDTHLWTQGEPIEARHW